MKLSRILIALLLSACLLCSVLPMGAAAASTPSFTYSEEALRAAMTKTETYMGNIIPSTSQITSITSTWQSQFSWDNEKRESNNKSYLFEWSYYNGVVFEGLDYIYDVTGDSSYYDKVDAYLSSMISGNTSTWKKCTNNSSKYAAGYVSYHGVDCYKTASLLLDYGYTAMAAQLYSDLQSAESSYSSSSIGYNFQHSWASSSSYSVWLDGLYMVQPFMAKYASYIGDTAELSRIAGRFVWIGNNMYNSSTGLYYHAANSASSHSDGYWLRAIGWYAAAMADVIPYMSGSDQTAMIAQLKKLVDGMLPYQDASTGMWHNYVDSTSSKLETSGTALLAYAMMKGINNGWLSTDYLAPAVAAYTGICNNKLSSTSLADICVKGSPGATNKNNTFAANEGKGLGPFLMTYAQMLLFLNNSSEPTVTGIEIDTEDATTVYHIGEEFSSDGVTVSAVYSDGNNVDVTEDAVITAPDMCNPGTIDVTVTWDTYTATYSITVSDHSAGNAVIENETDATCTADGSYDTVIYCSECGEELSRVTTTVPATGHDYTSAITTEPGCTTEGIRTYTCECGESYTEAIPATGHTAGEAVIENNVPATCTADGSYDTVVYCKECGEELSRVTTTVPATGHVYTSAITTEPTCTTEGVRTYTCECGDSYTEAIPATGHTAGEAVIENNVPATCTADGSYDTVVYCKECGEELSRVTTTVPATGHNYTSAITTAPGCTTEGVRTYTCECGESYTEAIPATGHTAGTAVIENNVPATCTADGSYDTVVYCKECGEELSRVTTTVPATGHNYTSAITTPATGTTDGVMTYTCTHCGHSYTEAIPATGAVGFIQDTDGIDSGSEYLIRTCADDGATYVLGVVNGSLTRVAVTLNNNTVEDPDDSIIWIITKSGSGYTIRNKATGKYLSVGSSSSSWGWYGWGSSSTSLKLSSSAKTWTISVSNSYYTFYTTSSNRKYYLRYSASSDAFQASTSSRTVTMFLYKG